LLIIFIDRMGAGRPTKYNTGMNKRVFKLALLGATDSEMALVLGIAESTLNEWKLKYHKFSESINKGKLEADANVAASLYKRSIGFNYDEVTYEKIIIDKDGQDDEDEIKVDAYKKKVVSKLVVPDVAAQNIWLKNRRSKVDANAQRWADKHEQSFTDGDGNDVSPIVFYLPDNGRPIEGQQK
jgi:hypothetical protein